VVAVKLPVMSWRLNFTSCQLLYQRPRIRKLASGAEAGATVLHRDPLDGAAANGAGFASLMWTYVNLDSHM